MGVPTEWCVDLGIQELVSKRLIYDVLPDSPETPDDGDRQ